VRLCERNNSADTKVNEEGEGGGAPDARAEIFSAAHGEDHGEAGCALQPMEVYGEADPMLEQDA